MCPECQKEMQTSKASQPRKRNRSIELTVKDKEEAEDKIENRKDDQDRDSIDDRDKEELNDDNDDARGEEEDEVEQEDEKEEMKREEKVENEEEEEEEKEKEKEDDEKEKDNDDNDDDDDDDDVDSKPLMEFKGSYSTKDAIEMVEDQFINFEKSGEWFEGRNPRQRQNSSADTDVRLCILFEILSENCANVALLWLMSGVEFFLEEITKKKFFRLKSKGLLWCRSKSLRNSDESASAENALDSKVDLDVCCFCEKVSPINSYKFNYLL